MGLFSLALLLACTRGAEEKQESAVAQKQESALTQKQDPIVAQVGDETITLEQFQEFSRKIPSYLQSKKTGLEREKNHLQTMIDRKLLLIEAVAQGIDTSPGFLRKTRKIKENKILGIFQLREIKVKMTQSEVVEFFEKEGFSKTVRYSEIWVDGEDKARAAMEELRAGKSFEQVAVKWSVDEETAARGGDKGNYSHQLDLHPIVGDAVFALEKDEVSELIWFAGTRYGIFKATDFATGSLNDELLHKVYRILYIEKFNSQRAAMVEKLGDEYGLEVDREGLHAFLKKIYDQASFETEEERNIALYSYDGGKITAEDFIDAVRYKKRELAEFTDSVQVVSFADSVIVPDAMIVEAARRAEVDKEEEVVSWFDNRREQLLMIELREILLEDKLSLSDEEVRKYYDGHIDDFMHPELLEIQEILVGTEEQALELAEQVRNGASLGEFARTHSIRSTNQRDEEGRMHVHDSEKFKFGGLVEAAQKASIGELTGPVEVTGGYSIFKVLSRKREEQTFERAKKRVRATVRWLKKQEIFEQYLPELRKKYASEVTIREDNLKLVSGTG